MGINLFQNQNLNRTKARIIVIILYKESLELQIIFCENDKILFLFGEGSAFREES